MEMMSALKAPPGILAVAHLPESFNQPVTTDQLCLFLDGVSDPGNVGTLVRIADWFGLVGSTSALNAQTSSAPKPSKAPWAPRFISLASCVLGARFQREQKPM